MSAAEVAARKATPRPLNMFCCGCSLDVGVKVVTLMHLFISVLVLAAVSSDVIGKSTQFAIWYENDLALAMCLAGWMLCGVFFSLAGFAGTLVKSEAVVRVYWYFATLSYLVMAVIVIKDLVLSGPCQSIPVLLNNEATAVTCGVFRVVNTVVVFGVLAIPLYFLFVVMSYCDNIAFGGQGTGFGDLAAGSDRFHRPWLYHKSNEEHDYVLNSRIQGSINGIGGYGNPNRGGGYGAVYEEAVSQGLGGSSTLFGRQYHDLNYPRATNTA